MRLIDADAFKDYIREACEDLAPLFNDNGKVARLVTESFCKDIDEHPTIQPEPHWIPCSERLPRQGQEVICQCRANMIKVLKLDACGDWYQDAKHCYMSGFVIAWMPLPEPYKEGQE